MTALARPEGVVREYHAGPYKHLTVDAGVVRADRPLTDDEVTDLCRILKMHGAPQLHRIRSVWVTEDLILFDTAVLTGDPATGHRAVTIERLALPPAPVVGP